MTVKIKKKQNCAKNCMVCGRENPFGLKADFYELEDGRVAAVASALPEHQSYPGRVHGGAVSALLDETIGRAVNFAEPDTWGVTLELNVKFRKPVPYGERLMAVGEITKNSKRFFEGYGEIVLPDGGIAATATAKYMKFPLESIADFDSSGDYWKTFPDKDDPSELEIPEKRKACV